jgi:hypothetical protein
LAWLNFTGSSQQLYHICVSISDFIRVAVAQGQILAIKSLEMAFVAWMTINFIKAQLKEACHKILDTLVAWIFDRQQSILGIFPPFWLQCQSIHSSSHAII